MTAFEISTVESGPRKVTRRVEVSAPAAEVFSLISNPHRHVEIDGSGTIRDVEVRIDHLAVGDKFSVGMKQYGVPYRITSTVTAADADRLLEWQHPWGWRWRWELRGTTRGSTEITETFDYSTLKHPFWLGISGMPRRKRGGNHGHTAGACAAVRVAKARPSLSPIGDGTVDSPTPRRLAKKSCGGLDGVKAGQTRLSSRGRGTNERPTSTTTVISGTPGRIDGCRR